MYCICGNNNRPKYVGTDKSFERNVGAFYCPTCEYIEIFIADEDGLLPLEARQMIVLEIVENERAMVCENENL